MFKDDDGSLTRRELLTTVARAGLAAPLAVGSAAFAAQAPRAPANVTVINRPGDPQVKSILTVDDLRFLGYIRLAREAGTMWFSEGALAFRRVGGQSRFFMQGDKPDGDPVVEFIVPDEAPHTDVASAPVAPLAKHWGSLLAGRTLTGGSQYRAGGLHWDETQKGLWWTFGDSYVPVQHHPTLGCSLINDANGTATSYGPWRTEWTSQTTRGALCKIPDAFASAHTGGKSTGIMAPQTSGNASSPFGASLSAMQLPDAARTPADVTSNSHWTIGSHGLILHDINHRQARDTNYRSCAWKVQYDCRQGATLLEPPALFGGVDPGAGENDTMLSMAWIDLPDKHGLLYFGQLATTPTGYKAVGDDNGLVHIWYGDPFRNDGTKHQTCCHGQDDPWFGATGPGAHYRVPMGWIYNPNDLIAVAQKKANLWSRVPASTFQWHTKVPALSGRHPSGMFGGAVFDAPTRRLYVTVRGKDAITHPPHSRPTVMVFEIR